MKVTRIRFDKQMCAADGCSNTFRPKRAGHDFCSEKCATYMRVKRYREEKRNGNAK